jgi:hypothetical protein
MTLGQVQWLLFFIALIDDRFFIVWILSLFFTDNKD